LEGFAMEDVGIFWPFLYFSAKWYILGPFVFVWNIVSRFGILYQQKSGNPGSYRTKNGQ
jgi:hypothetical protein